MCLIISIIFTALAYTFFEDGNMQGFYINISIALFFILLIIKNTIKTKKERKN
jgi:hypothetical protein